MKKVFMMMAVVLFSATMFTSCKSKNDPTIAGPINKQWSYEFQQVGWVETNIVDLSVVGKITTAYTRSTWNEYTINIDNVDLDSVVYSNAEKTAGTFYYKNKQGTQIAQSFKDLTETTVNFVVGGGSMVQPYTKSNISYR